MPKKSPCTPEFIAYLKYHHPEPFRTSRSLVRAVDAAVEGEVGRWLAAGLPLAFVNTTLRGRCLPRNTTRAKVRLSRSERARRAAMLRHAKHHATRRDVIELYGREYANSGVSKDEAAWEIVNKLSKARGSGWTPCFETVRDYLKGLTSKDFLRDLSEGKPYQG